MVGDGVCLLRGSGGVRALAMREGGARRALRWMERVDGAPFGVDRVVMRNGDGMNE